MTAAEQSFALTGKPGEYRVALDGVEVTDLTALVGLTFNLDTDVDHVPVVTLTLDVPDLLNLELERARVIIDSDSRAGLIRLGWTPPAGQQ